MRSQINGLNQAVNNANDAIGLIQTAEGAMTETHSMLQRMKTPDYPGSKWYLYRNCKKNIKAEIDALNSEITRIASTTEFNGEKPLNPKPNNSNLTFYIGASADKSQRNDCCTADYDSGCIKRLKYPGFYHDRCIQGNEIYRYCN